MSILFLAPQSLLYPLVGGTGAPSAMLLLIREEDERLSLLVSVTNAVLHPWLQEQLGAVLAEIEQLYLPASLQPETERP